MTDTDTLARHEAKTEPPKRWVTRLKIDRPGSPFCRTCRKREDVAPPFAFSCQVFPSAELAEQYGKELDRANSELESPYIHFDKAVPAP